MIILTGKIEDKTGKEAFAYLAITLIVLSSFFISYMASYRRYSEECESRSQLLVTLTKELDEFEIDIISEILSTHDQTYIEILYGGVDGNSTRSDSMLEVELLEIVPSILNNTIRSYMKKDDRFILKVDEITVDVVPLTIYHDIPVSDSTFYNLNGTGRLGNCLLPGSRGVNSSITIVLKCTDREEKINVLRTIEKNIVRESELDVVRTRLDLLRDSLSGFEVVELTQNILTSLANSKAYLGYGRETIQSSARSSLLVEKEISSGLELAVNLLSAQYLGIYDDLALQNIDENFRSIRGSNNCSPSLISILKTYSGTLDAGMLVQILEGLFSEKCPPTAEEILRPLIMSLAERLIIGTMDYIGLEPDTLQEFGSIHDLFLTVEKKFENFLETVSGRNIISTAEKAARKLITDLYKLDGRLCGYEGLALIRSHDGFEYFGEKISGYPVVDPKPINISAVVDLKNGTIFSRYLVEICLDPSEEENIALNDEDEANIIKDQNKFFN